MKSSAIKTELRHYNGEKNGAVTEFRFGDGTFHSLRIQDSLPKQNSATRTD